MRQPGPAAILRAEEAPARKEGTRARGAGFVRAQVPGADAVQQQAAVA